MNGASGTPTAAVPRSTAPADLAAAALALARRLADDAVRDDAGAPQWIGDEVDAVADAGGSVLRRGPVDDGLLTGRAGIALALAVAARQSGDEALASLAAATMADVLAARRTPRRHGLGWQSGDLGIAVAAQRVAAATDRPELARHGRRLAARAVAILASADAGWLPGYADLLDGSAGHLLAVLAADLPTASEAHRATAAARLVHDLRARAVVDEVGARWPMAAGDRAVTGLAHGSTGIGLALAAARRAGTPGADPGLIEAARQWEDAWYSADDGGWYDLRLDEPAVGLAWCHGAPGIGIAAALRSHLGDPDGEETYLRALRSVATAGAPLDDDDATLCHGSAGIVELHLAGAEAAWGADEATRAERLRAARAAASHIAAGVRADGTTAWRHGVPGGSSPAVLDGTAGVALTLLRCIAPVASAAQPPLRVG